MKKRLFKIAWKSLAAMAVFIVLILVAENLRGRFLLAGWEKEMRQKGERLTVAEWGFKPANPPWGFQENFGFLAQLNQWGATTGKDVQLATGEQMSWNDLENRMEAAAEPLAKLRQALKNPPLTTGQDLSAIPNLATYFSDIISNYVAWRSAAQMVSAAALNAAHQGNIGELSENLSAMASLAALYQEDTCLSALMIRVAVTGMSMVTTANCLSCPGWTGNQLQRVQEAWQRVELVTKISPTMELERLLSRTMLEQSTVAGWQKHFDSSSFFGEGMAKLAIPVWGFAWLRQDQLAVLEKMVEIRNMTRPSGVDFSGYGGISWQDLSAKLAALEEAGDKNTSSSLLRQVRYPLGSPSSVALVGNCSRAFSKCYQNQAWLDLVITAIAVKRYYLSQGGLPPDLATLAPHYLPRIPRDVMDNRPLRYRSSTNSACVIYSVGADGRDDGGLPNPTSPDVLSEGKDIVLSLHF